MADDKGPWIPVSSGSPNWGNPNGWGKPQYYSTIQAAGVNGTIYAIARAAAGIQTYKLNGNKWEHVQTSTPRWADSNGWNQPQYYSTIQTAVAKNTLYLLGRSASGIMTFKLNADKWELVQSDSPYWADGNGWGEEQYYSTIQTAVVNDTLYLIGRGWGGIVTYRLDGNKWVEVESGSPEWSNPKGWGKHQYYSTIQTAVVKDTLYLLARASAGIVTFKLNGDKWEEVQGGSPYWADENGWGDKQYYSTIQTAVVNDTLYLIGRGWGGIVTYRLDGNKWVEVKSGSPEWSNPKGWGKHQYYSTIQTAVVKDTLYLLARASAGIVTFKLNGDKWEEVESGSPYWADENGWGDEQYYSTIQAVVSNNALYILGRGYSGMVTFTLHTKDWGEVQSGSPYWADENGWGSEQHYSTIQTAVANDVMYLVARGWGGIVTDRLNGDKWEGVNSGSPEWSNPKGWNHPQYYSTIQTAVVKDKLYLTGRAARGMLTYRLNGNEWEEVVSGYPDLADGKGWDDLKYYSTIQTSVVKDTLYLLARASWGIKTYRLNGHKWEDVVFGSPRWGDRQGWGHPQYYSTIQTAVVKDTLYLLARAARGMLTYRLNGDKWEEVAAYSPEWSNSRGWNHPEYYSTIQTAVVKDTLYLLARAARGMVTFKLNGNKWEEVTAGSPYWANENGWNSEQYYSTIQAAVANDTLHLFARGYKGMVCYKLNGTKWEEISEGAPKWSNPNGWNVSRYYSTIQSAVLNGKLYLLGRSASGMETYQNFAVFGD